MEKTIWVYVLLTLLIGGGAAIMMGRNFAQNWRSVWAVVFASLGLALGVRFLHFALFQEQLLTPIGYAIDALSLMAIALFGFRWRRAQQMTSQYFWLYERTGLLSWRSRAEPGHG
jgi:hypothetical protein